MDIYNIKNVEFSHLIQKDRAYISMLTKRGKILKEDGFYSLKNDINLNFLYSRGITQDQIDEFINSIQNKKSKLTKEPKIKTIEHLDPEPKIIEKIKPVLLPSDKTDITDDEFVNISGLPASMMKLNLKQLVMRYGGQMQLKNWADILNKLMMSAEKDQKMQERRLDVISKDFVRSKQFSYLEALSVLLFDFPESCIDNIIAVVKSKPDCRNELVNDMRKELGILIEQTKNSIDRELDGLLSRYSEERDSEIAE